MAQGTGNRAQLRRLIRSCEHFDVSVSESIVSLGWLYLLGSLVT